MFKSDLLRVFGTQQAIADVFAPFNGGAPLTRGAISQWNEAIPELRAFQIRKLVPDIDVRIERAKQRAAA